MKKANREKSGTIFNIQKFSVNDGPGIRTVVFFKGCPLHCRWCSNPESQLPKQQILWNQKVCKNCLQCKTICPLNAISFTEGHIHINANQCNTCQECVAHCPEKALSLEGEERTVQEIIDVVLQDRVFYEEGGGITVSGGEFLTQPDFAYELLLAAKEEGLHTCCETTGYASSDVFERMLPLIDYVFFDMKHWDAQQHIAGTGVSNSLPLANMKIALQMKKTVLPRIPVIPGYNDSIIDALEFAALLQNLNFKECQLLPFHQFGENKYHLLDQPYAYTDVPSYHQEDLQSYLNVFLTQGIHAFF